MSLARADVQSKLDETPVIHHLENYEPESKENLEIQKIEPSTEGDGGMMLYILSTTARTRGVLLRESALDA